MTEIVGKRVLVATENTQAVQERLESCGVRFEFIPRDDETEVRYSTSRRADHLVAPYILPPGY